MAIDLTDQERKLIGFALACHIDDRIKEAKRRKFGPEHPYCAQVAEIQRVTYTKIIPESLCGDDVLADGSILRKPK